MGQELQHVSMRLSPADVGWLDESVAEFHPFVGDRSAMLRIVVQVMRALIVMRMVCWSVLGVQEVLCGHCGRDSVSRLAASRAQTDAEAGLPGALLEERGKRAWEPRIQERRQKKEAA